MTNTEQNDIEFEDMVDVEDTDPKSEFLTFTLEGNSYAVDILRVQEIRGWQEVTRVPNTPIYVTGVLNMRGAIVPIVDLREKFKFAETEYTALHVIIVLSVYEGDAEKIMGIIVDGVQDVIAVKQKSIKLAPKVSENDQLESIAGLASVKEHMVTILDVDKLLSLGISSEQGQ